jgi:acetylornithine deacetylase/succinyl-diaminopimelate desuccinylase-like protein
MEEVEREIGQLLQEIGEEDREFYFTCERFVGLQGWKAREGSRLVEHGVRAYRKCFGEDPQFGDLGATCEAALFAGFGADTVVFGPGSMGRAHTRDEWIEVDHLIRAARFYKTLVEDILVTKDR